MKKDIWNEIIDLTVEYKKLGISESIDYDKFYLYSLIAHSTQIEGSTLTELDTKLLFDDGLTAGNKPLLFHYMNIDLKNAYEQAIQMAKAEEPVTPEFLKRIGALVMKQTGSIHNGIAGTWDETKGEFRKHNVTAGYGGRSYVNYQKVEPLIEEFCIQLTEQIKNINMNTTLKDKYLISFDAHYNLVTIHPFSDGNGRTSRLLMNYVQFYLGITPTKIYSEDKKKYIQALEECRDKNTLEPIREFLAEQQVKMLKEEIVNYKKDQERNNNFTIKF